MPSRRTSVWCEWALQRHTTALLEYVRAPLEAATGQRFCHLFASGMFANIRHSRSVRRMTQAPCAREVVLRRFVRNQRVAPPKVGRGGSSWSATPLVSRSPWLLSSPARRTRPRPLPQPPAARYQRLLCPLVRPVARRNGGAGNMGIRGETAARGAPADMRGAKGRVPSTRSVGSRNGASGSVRLSRSRSLRAAPPLDSMPPPPRRRSLLRDAHRPLRWP
jgi:hypothetical protein